MGEKTDELKGRAKEMLGEVTDDERLRREGRLDRVGGAIKGAAEAAKDKVEEVVDEAKRASREAR